MTEDKRGVPGGDAQEPSGPQNDGPDTATAEKDTRRDFVTGILLASGGKVSDYYWNNIDLRVGDLCVVRENDHLEFGSVSLSRRPLAAVCKNKRPAGVILRKANEKDADQAAANARREKSAMTICRERIYERDLQMKLSRVHYSFDGRKAIFFFTAESRVDFRELVKDLANYTRVKVEMRQIGVRDEARMIGGCGPCGHELCCSTFLADFAPVSIRMAKDQFMSLSPEKISGVCGRLMCCLAYEHGTYKELQKKSPKMGKMVEAPDGKMGRVFQLNLLTERIGISFEDGAKVEYDIAELSQKRGEPRVKAELGPGVEDVSVSPPKKSQPDIAATGPADEKKAPPKPSAETPPRRGKPQRKKQKSRRFGEGGKKDEPRKTQEMKTAPEDRPAEEPKRPKETGEPSGERRPSRKRVRRRRKRRRGEPPERK